MPPMPGINNYGRYAATLSAAKIKELSRLDMKTKSWFEQLYRLKIVQIEVLILA